MLDASVLDMIDLIYSAGIDQAAWAAVLHKLAGMTGCIAGGLTIEDPAQGSGRPLTFFGFDPGHVRDCFDHYLPMNPLFAIESRMWPGFVVTNGMVVEESEFRRSEFYNGWARPQGLCSPLSLVLHRQQGRYIPLTLVRPDGAGEATEENVALLETLSPHLIRAMDITLTMERSGALNQALRACLDHLSVGIILLDGADRVLRVNEAAENYFREGAIDAGRDGIKAQSSVKGEIEHLLAKRRHDTSGALTDVKIERGGAAPLTLSVVPADGETSFDDARVTTMVIIQAEDPVASPSLRCFAEYFALTARETELLTLLALEGLSLLAIAGRLGISLATVKTHLQRIFEKTSTSRQSQLLSKVINQPR